MKINWTDLEATSREYDLDLGELFSIFFKQSENKMREIKVAVDSKDSEVLRNAAHFMAGSAGALHLEDLRISFKEVEEKAVAQDFSNLEEKLVKIQEEISEISQAVVNKNYSGR